MERTVRPGRHAPLGATFDGQGVNFAVYSEKAKGMELCLFDEKGEEKQRIPLREHTMHVWHCYVHGVRPGQRYGYRARGLYEPSQGLLFNPH
jgi:isoamylase